MILSYSQSPFFALGATSPWDLIGQTVLLTTITGFALNVTCMEVPDSVYHAGKSGKLAGHCYPESRPILSLYWLKLKKIELS